MKIRSITRYFVEQIRHFWWVALCLLHIPLSLASLLALIFTFHPSWPTHLLLFSIFYIIISLPLSLYLLLQVYASAHFKQRLHALLPQYFPAMSPPGQIKHLLTQTEKLAEEFVKIRTEREKNEKRLEKLQIGLWEWDIQQHQFNTSQHWANEQGLNSTNLTADFELLSEHIHPDEKNRVMACMTAHLHGETPAYDSTHRVRHQQGHYFWVRERGVAERNQQQQAVRVWGISQPIDTDKPWQDALNQLATMTCQDPEQFIKACIQVLSDAYQASQIIIGRFNDENSSHWHTLGFINNQVWQPKIDYHLADLLGFSSFPDAQTNIQRRGALSLRLLYRDAQQIYTGKLVLECDAESCFCVPLRNQDNSIFGHILVLDSNRLTPQWWHRSLLQLCATRLAGELLLANQREHKLHLLHSTQRRNVHENQSKNRLLTGLSYEWRTRLSGMLGNTELLLMQQKKDSEPEHMLRSIYYDCESLLHRLNTLNDFSRLEAQELKLHPRDFVLGQFLEETCNLFQAVLTQHPLTLKLNLKPGLPSLLRADTGRLQQMLLTLFKNSLKYTQQGHITLDIHTVEDHTNKVKLCFSVYDTGEGMSIERQAEVRHALREYEDAILHSEQGPSLGLLVVQGLAHMMGGELSFDSTPGQGSCFAFNAYLDKQTFNRTQRHHHVHQIADKIRNQQVQILVAEDSPINQAVIKRMLKRLGYNVEVADNGQQVLTRFLERPYDLILMDCEMPEMDGYEATKLIRQHELSERLPRTPIIALTAYALPEHRERTREAGMDDHVTKPVTLDTLRHSLQHWVQKLAESPNHNNHQTLTHISAAIDESSAQAAIDERILGSLRKVLGDGVETVIEQFINYAPQQLKTLQNALREQDSEALRQKAHQFKGESVQIGALHLGELCKKLEVLAKDKTLQELPDLIQRIEVEMMRVLEILQGEISHERA